MNTHDIRVIVEGKLEEEKSTGAYYSLLKSSLDETQSQIFFNFTTQYLRNTPNLIDQVFNTADSANCLSTFQPIFNALFNYWEENYDYIPDHIGIAGICDDAYLSMSLMQMLANSTIPGTNRVLMPGVNNDLQQQNNVMANILGPAVATQLNAVANQTYQSVYIQDAMNNIFNTAGMNALFGAGSLNMMQNTLDQNRIDEQVNTQLGAMGIF